MSRLTVARRVGQSILIGDDVRVTVVRHARGGLRLCVEAPPEVEVDREEVRERKRAEGRRRGGET